MHQSFTLLPLIFSIILFSLLKCEFKTFVINLKSRTDKLAQITEQLKEKGIEYEVFEGVDGKLLERYLKEFKCSEPRDENKSDEFKLIASVMNNQEIKLNWNNLLNDMTKKSMGFGHVGCWLSHLMLLLELKRRIEVVGPVLILEDDSIILETLVENFEQARKSLPTDWGIYYAGHCSGSVDEISDDYCGCGGEDQGVLLAGLFREYKCKGNN